MSRTPDLACSSDALQGTVSKTEGEADFAPFERLLIRVSTLLASARRDDLTGTVEQALNELLGFCSIERVSLFKVVSEESHVRFRRVAAVPCTAGTRDEIPPEAALHQPSLQASGPESLLHVPLEVGAEVRFVLAAASLERAPAWDAGCIVRLKSLGELVAHAISSAEAVGALLASQHETRETLDVMHLGRGEWDVGADKLHLSKEAKHILGTDVRSMTELLAIVEQADRGELERTIERARTHAGERFSARYAIGLPDGARRIIQQWHELLPSGGESERLVATIQDVTATLKAEEELLELRTHHWHSARVAQTSLLVASLAHELCQPLSAILNNAQAGLRFLRNENLSPEEMKDILTDIVASNKRASEVLGALRAMLRRKNTTRVTFDVADAVQDVIGLVRSELMSEQIELETSLAPECYLNADKTQIEQVVLNLVMNSIDAMRAQRHVERRLQLTASVTDRREVHVSVVDWGRGIPPEKIRRVFDAFWTTKKKGLGMGLSVCRAIVESYGGRIWCENNAAGGATFHFALPLTSAPDPAAAERTPSVYASE